MQAKNLLGISGKAGFPVRNATASPSPLPPPDWEVVEIRNGVPGLQTFKRKNPLAEHGTAER